MAVTQGHASPRMPPADCLAFLPAAQELRDTPPRASRLYLVRLLVSVVLLALLWSALGEVDVVAVASGRVIPGGRSKPLQSLDAGVVRELLVREGQRVRAGDALLRLDEAELRAERQRVHGEFAAEQMERARAVALRWRLEQETGAGDEVDKLFGQALAELDLERDALAEARHLLLLENEWRQYAREQELLRRDDATRAAEQQGAAAIAFKLERTLPILEERARAAADLYGRQLLAREQWMERDLQRMGAEQDLAAARARLEAAASERAGIAARIAAARQTFLARLLMTAEEHRRRAAALRQDLLRIDERLGRFELSAPIDGVVQQLAVRGPGAVVKPAESLLVVVPLAEELEVEAMVLNRDIGFVEEGQAASVKVETFSFTRYGLLSGRVRSLSAEAVENPGLGLVYPVRVALNTHALAVEGRRAELVPGMAVQVEIHTGRRRIIDYFLSPVRRVVQESIRER